MIAFPFGEGVISVSSKDGTEMTDEVIKLICKVLVETRYYRDSANIDNKISLFKTALGGRSKVSLQQDQLGL